MRLWAISLFFGVLCPLHWVQALDCRDKNSMQQEQLKCFTRYNITLNTNGKDLQNALYDDPEAVCRQQEEYKRAMRCAFDVAKTCLRLFSIRTDILPDADRMADGISYMCRHVTDISPQCMHNSQPLITQCVTNRALVELSSTTRADDNTTACAVFHFTYDCMKQHLDYCSGRTLEVSLELTNAYLRPPACSPFDEGNEDPSSLTTGGSSGEGDFSDFERCELERTGLQCFLSERLGIMELFNPPRGALDNTTTAQYLFNKKVVGKFCTQKEGLKRAFSCVYSAVKQCMQDTQWISYLPDVSKYLTVIDDVCETVDDINYTCVIDAMEKFTTCASEKADITNFNGWENLKEGVCQLVLDSTECFKDVMSECGCPTTRLVVKSVKNLNPPVCSAIESATPECNPFTTHQPANTTTTPITGEFEGGKGGARQSSGLASLITMLLVLLMSSAAV
ncbi:hypothetical protein BaRGS_00019628 [Batillaria attramentaria]|uniref:Uncharacterized protein n=1 Tax=Batillaria attramentaria TaxID=370345 RepID=A0ABD0KPX6_9CAEN